MADEMPDKDLIAAKVKPELENLNDIVEKTNELELSLTENQRLFEQEMEAGLDALVDMIEDEYLSKAIKKAEPHYVALMELELAKAKRIYCFQEYRRALLISQFATEHVSLSHESAMSPAWQELLAHGAERSSEFQQAKAKTDIDSCQERVAIASRFAAKTLKQHQIAVKTSKPYYELKSELYGKLTKRVDVINELMVEKEEMRQYYARTMRRLEEISNSVHDERALNKTPTANFSSEVTEQAVTENMVEDLKMERENTVPEDSRQAQSQIFRIPGAILGFVEDKLRRADDALVRTVLIAKQMLPK